MWTPEQLDNAKYTVYHEYESKQPLNVGIIEIEGTNTGTYMITPVPPCGGLVGEAGAIAGQKTGTHTKSKNLTIAYMPKGLPVPVRPTNDGPYVIHEYGD